MLEKVTIRKAVEFAVKTEELGNLFYTKLARKFADNDELKEIFELLAKDEAIHEKQFRKLLDQTHTKELEAGQEERFEFLRAMSLSEFFMDEEGLYRRTEEITDRKSALLRAFELEKATLQYYQAMKDVLGEDNILDSVIIAEKRHVMKLMEILLTEAKFRGIQDSF